MGTVLLNHMQQGLERVGGGLSATVRDKIANPQNCWSRYSGIDPSGDLTEAY